MNVTETPDENGSRLEPTLDPNEESMGAMNILRIIVCTIGLFGNLTVILTILIVGELRKRITGWYVLQLAIADTAFLITLPFDVVEDLHGEWIFPEWMCKAKETMLFINYYASMSFLTIMAIDRYIAICRGFSEGLYKFRNRRAVYIITAITWTVAIAICVPIMIYTRVQGFQPTCTCRLAFPEEPDLRTIDEQCIAEAMGDNTVIGSNGKTELQNCRDIMLEIENDEDYCQGPLEETDKPEVNATGLNVGCHIHGYSSGFVAILYFNLIVMFLVPFIIITICYTLIVRYIIKTSDRVASMSGGSQTGANKSQNRTRVLVMCVLLVVVFTICWLPYHALTLAKARGIRGSAEYCATLLRATTVLVYLNSAINPFIYFIVAHVRRHITRFQNSSVVNTFLTLITRRGQTGRSESATNTTGSSKSTAPMSEGTGEVQELKPLK